MNEIIEKVIKPVLRLADWLPSLDQGLDESQRNTVKLAVRSYCQTNWYACGAVAGWAVLEAFKPKASYGAFYGECAPDPCEGMSEGAIARALRNHRITAAYKRNMDFADIRAAIDRGYPLIVGVGFDYPDGDHWMVIYGYGRRPDRVYLANPRERVGWKTFRDGYWNPTGAALVCSRNGKGVPRIEEDGFTRRRSKTESKLKW
jgi:Peptidase_C39 like family